MNGIEGHVLRVEELAEAKELQERVRKAIDDLPEQERLVVTLYYMNGLTQHDIADFVGISESTVRRRLRSSRTKLKGELSVMVQEDLQKHDLTHEFTDRVAFKVESLEAAIRNTLKKSKEPLTKDDLEKLAGLTVRKQSINDISSLSGLTKIGEGGCQMQEGIQLHLVLSDNRISDISPLVSNRGIGDSDGINLKGNPLSDSAYNFHIPALQERGVNVLFDPKPEQ